MHGLVARVLDLDGEEQRRLALVDLLHRVGRVGVALRSVGQLLRELEQQLQPFLGPTSAKSSTSSASGAGRVTPAHCPWTIGTRTVLPHSVQLPS